jgi:peptidoglycan/LPS O-acetylase OafA/YrhL
MTLSEHFNPRQNALTPLRLLLALMVVAGHAWEVGGFGADPLQRFTGVTLGEVAVNGFFAISGFLVTGSWIKSSSSWSFLKKRALRILPGFWACLLLTGLLLFPWLAHQKHGTRWLPQLIDGSSYVLHNSLLRISQSNVADLFSHQPADRVANGSLWSLLPEALCYLAVLFAGLLGLFKGRRFGFLLLLIFVLYLFQIEGSFISDRLHGSALYGKVWYLWRLDTQSLYFLSGAILYLLADKVPVSSKWAWLLGGSFLVVTCFGLYIYLAPVLLGYLLLVLAGSFRYSAFEKMGDYSYGIYVYHYPIQQTLVFFGLNNSDLGPFMATALLIVLPLAVLSWYCIEEPALRFKRKDRKPVHRAMNVDYSAVP